MPKILFPTDFSEAASRAWQYALQWASKAGMEIITLHVYELPDLKGASHLHHTLEDFYESIEANELKQYRKALAEMQAVADALGFKDIKTQHLLEKGRPSELILKIAREQSVALLVMGTTGRRGVESLLMGSTTSEILEHSPCPVLAVPGKTSFDGHINHIVFATHYAEKDKPTLLQILGWAGLFGAKVHCLNIEDDNNEEPAAQNLSVFKEGFEDRPDLDFHLLLSAESEAAMIDFGNQHQADCIAMVAQRRSFLERLFNYSNSRNLAIHLNLPVLIFPG